MKFKVFLRISKKEGWADAVRDFLIFLKKRNFTTDEDGVIKCEKEDLDEIAKKVKEKKLEMNFYLIHEDHAGESNITR